MNSTSAKLTLSALALASLGLAAIATTTAYAEAPMLKASAPGYYRTLVGAFEVTAISDGTVALPVDRLLTNTTPQAVDAELAAAFETSPLETSDNAYLINTGSKLVLVDTGAGTLFGPTLGKLLTNIEASGYRPDQIDEILVTHMHPDHVGGLAGDGKAVFPNAIVHAAKADADYWLSQANLDAAPEAAKGFFQGAITSFQPYVEAKRLETFDGPTEFLPGLRSVALPGHTAGHTGYLVESEGQRLLIWGDVVHVAAVQFAHPQVTIQFDSDSGEAAGECAKLLANAADRKISCRRGTPAVSGPGPCPQTGRRLWLGGGELFRITLTPDPLRCPQPHDGRAHQPRSRRSALEPESVNAAVPRTPSPAFGQTPVRDKLERLQLVGERTYWRNGLIGAVGMGMVTRRRHDGVAGSNVPSVHN